MKLLRSLHFPPSLVPFWGLWLLLGLGACQDETGVTNHTVYERDTLRPAPVDTTAPVDSFPLISPEIVQKVRPADGFDFPVGPPDAEDYYKYRGFLPNDLEHLGEDWNGIGGGNTDQGDYVFAAADGVVFFAEDFGGGWGIVIRMLHNYGTEAQPNYIESLYAHVASAWVRPGNRMKRGEIIGTIGSAGGIYHAHLHFEMRGSPGKPIPSGYEGDTLGFVDPTDFIQAHRPQRRP
ncbi:MAG: M23 family metallopeptidase [Bacteroidota bacterium]